METVSKRLGTPVPKSTRVWRPPGPYKYMGLSTYCHVADVVLMATFVGGLGSKGNLGACAIVRNSGKHKIMHVVVIRRSGSGVYRKGYLVGGLSFSGFG